MDEVAGTCHQMCPEEEILWRSQARLIHRLEARNLASSGILQRDRIPDNNKMVKAYCRPAAGQDNAKPHLLRPFSTLLLTTNYLLNIARCKENNGTTMSQRYDFIADRLRSVRQDAVVQRLPRKSMLCILEAMLPFYAYFDYYRFCNPTLISFDQNLHKNQFEEVAILLREFYTNENCQNSTISPKFLSEIWLFYQTNYNDCAWFYANFSSCLNDDAKELYYCLHNNNFLRFFSIFRRSTPIRRLILSQFVPKLRFLALKIIRLGFNARKLPFSKSLLCDWLDFDQSSNDLENCLSDLKCVKISENLVRFWTENIDFHNVSGKPHWRNCKSLRNIDFCDF